MPVARRHTIASIALAPDWLPAQLSNTAGRPPLVRLARPARPGCGWRPRDSARLEGWHGNLARLRASAPPDGAPPPVAVRRQRISLGKRVRSWVLYVLMICRSAWTDLLSWL